MWALCLLLQMKLKGVFAEAANHLSQTVSLDSTSVCLLTSTPGEDELLAPSGNRRDEMGCKYRSGNKSVTCCHWPAAGDRALQDTSTLQQSENLHSFSNYPAILQTCLIWFYLKQSLIICECFQNCEYVLLPISQGMFTYFLFHSCLRENKQI